MVPMASDPGSDVVPAHVVVDYVYAQPTTRILITPAGLDRCYTGYGFVSCDEVRILGRPVVLTTDPPPPSRTFTPWRWNA